MGSVFCSPKGNATSALTFLCDVSRVSASAGHLWLIPEQHELKKWKFGRVDGTAAGDPKPTLNGLVSRKSSWHLRHGSREGKKDTLVRLAASKETVLKRAAVNTAQSCQNEKSAGFHTA